MKTNALGLIEVKGYIGAIEAADAALKAANVTLIKLEKIRSGLVTVLLTGDVGAIRAAVDAGKDAAEKCGTIISTHVIARPHEETSALFQPQNSLKESLTEDGITSSVEKVVAQKEIHLGKAEKNENEVKSNEESQRIKKHSNSHIEADSSKSEGTEKRQSPETTPISGMDMDPIAKAAPSLDLDNSGASEKEHNESGQNHSFNVEELKGKKVEELRKIARSLHLENVKPNEIKYGRKDFLIQILTDNQEGASE